MTLRVLVVGGTGAFGARLVEGLVATTDLDVVIGARGLARAEKLAANLHARHPARRIAAVGLDVAALSAPDLRRLGVWCVVDAAGPFQGAAPRLAQAAIAAGCHYIDLADARDFVARFPALDAAARAAGVVAVTGASSTPALSHAVLDRLAQNFDRIDRIEIAISPGNRAPRGLSVMRAILSGAGQPVRMFGDGVWSSARGWGLLTRRRMPGLGRRWLSLVETPDLDLVPQRFAPREAAIFRAGLELSIMHLGLWGLSRLVALGALKSLAPLAPVLHWLAERLKPLGTDRGGMSVAVAGRDRAGIAALETWALVAAAGDGPNIPTLPALALLRSMAAGKMLPAGAYPCVGLLALQDIAAEFARFRIVVRRCVRPRGLFPRLLGAAFDAIPEPIRRGHTVDGRLVLTGRASVEGAGSLAGRVVARLFGFPAAAADLPVRVEMRADGEGEVWRREFAAHKFSSRLTPVPGRQGLAQGLAYERFGLVTFTLAVTADADGLVLRALAARLGPIPLPGFLTPRSVARESVDPEGRFSFDVPITLPGIGRLVHYRGWLVPETPQ